MPLRVGNTWDYAASFEEDGNIFDTTLSLSVTGTWYSGDVKYYTIEQTSLARNTDDGLILGTLDDSEVIRDRLFKYPVGSVESYEYIGIDPVRTLQVLVDHDTIDVEAGSFDCITYAYSDTLIGANYNYYYCFKPGLGFVLFRATGASRSTEYRLSSYSVK